MSFLYRHFYHRFRVPDQETDFPHRFSSLSINPSEGNVEDDWELLEILDKEFGDMDMGTVDEDDGDIDMRFPEELSFTSHDKIKFRIMSKADVCARLRDKVKSVTMVLALSRNDALILLHKFKWSVQRTQEEWLTCEEDVRNAVGLYEKPVTDIPYSDEITCGLCLASLKAGTLYAVSCGHHFCQKCWTDYITAEINKGPECLTMRCPGMSCKAAVGLDMVELMASQEEKKTFDDYLFKSSITSSRKGKWCPAPGCEFAMYSSTRSDDSIDVTCCCFHSICWSCSEEAHAPVQCATAVEWKSESFLQSNNWILANTRPCQHCGNLMDALSDPVYSYSRCSNCSNFRYQGAAEWTCDTAESSVMAAPSDEDRERARKSLERFQEYYQGWSVSEAARANALTDLEVLQKLQLEILCNVFYLDEKEFEFLVEAQKQVVHCWRLLKWMYVYGFYLPEDENDKRALFEFMQDQALRLVCMLAKNVLELLNSVQSEDFCLPQYEVFRGKIVRLTRVTRSYLDRFVEGVKSGLTEVMTLSEKSPRPNIGEASCSSCSPCSSPTETGLKETQDQDLFSKPSPVMSLLGEPNLYASP